MIFFAVAGPTPFNASRSFSLAVFKSTSAPDVGDVVAALAVVVLAAGGGGVVVLAAAGAPMVTSGVMAVIVFAVTPALARSPTAE